MIQCCSVKLEDYSFRQGDLKSWLMGHLYSQRSNKNSMCVVLCLVWWSCMSLSFPTLTVLGYDPSTKVGTYKIISNLVGKKNSLTSVNSIESSKIIYDCRCCHFLEYLWLPNIYWTMPISCCKQVPVSFHRNYIKGN